MRASILAIALLAAFTPSLPGSAQTQPNAFDPKLYRSSIVAILAKGVSPKLGNLPVTVQGTGFITSRDGFVVTSRHLKTELGDVDPSTITFEIHFKSPADPDFVPATPVFENDRADLMVLYGNLDDHTFTPLNLSNHENITPGTTAIFTVGFPQGYSYSSDNAIVRTKYPSLPFPAWATSFSFRAGQSGSPVLVASGGVVAIVKGSDAASPAFGIVVPSRLVPQEYWDNFTYSQAGIAALKEATTSPATSQPIRILVDAPIPTSATASRASAISVQNDPCVGFAVQKTHVNATSGWSIDLGSVRFISLTNVGSANEVKIVNLTPQGFDVIFELQNEGQCIGTTRDLPARIDGNARYLEHALPDKPQLVPATSSLAVQDATSPLPFGIPLNQLQFSVRSANGTAQSFIPQADEIIQRNGERFLDISKVAARVVVNTESKSESQK